MSLSAPNTLLSQSEPAELLNGAPQSVGKRLGLATTPSKKPNAEPLALTDHLAIQNLGGGTFSEANRAKAAERYQIIEPLINPDKFSELWWECENNPKSVIQHLAAQSGVSAATIEDWFGKFGAEGYRGLVRRGRSDLGRSRSLNRAAVEFVQSAALVYDSAKEVFRAYQEERPFRAAIAGKQLTKAEVAQVGPRNVDQRGYLCESAQLPVADYKTILRCIARLPKVARVMARQGDEAFSNSQEIISWRDIAALQPMDYVVMDHRVLDIFCLVRSRDGWHLVRPWLTAAIEMRTRKWLGWVVVETPSSDSIAAVLKRVFLDHGLPERVYWDNGKDFRCEWLEGKHTRKRQSGKVSELDASWRGVLDSLGVRVHHAIPYRARSKMIEPNFVRIANADKTMPEYCGHKPTARPERFAELIGQHEAWVAGQRETTPFRTIEQIAAIYNDVIEDLNERELQGEGMHKVTPTGRGWMCPNEAWELLTRHVERRTVKPEDLQFCFTKRRELKVQHGELKMMLAGRPYHYRILGNDRALMMLNGETVELATDPLDLGEAAVYYQARFVGLAHCVELRRMGDSAFTEDERLRRGARREVKRFLRAMNAAVPVPNSETRLERRKAVLPSRDNVPRLERPAEMPAAIAEAQAAAREERDFQFKAVDVDVARATKPTQPNDDDSDVFNFFQGD